MYSKLNLKNVCTHCNVIQVHVLGFYNFACAWLLSEALLCYKSGLAIAKYFATVFHLLTQTTELRDLNMILPQQKSLHFYFIQANKLSHAFHILSYVTGFAKPACPNHTTNEIHLLVDIIATHKHYPCRHSNNIRSYYR